MDIKAPCGPLQTAGGLCSVYIISKEQSIKSNRLKRIEDVRDCGKEYLWRKNAFRHV